MQTIEKYKTAFMHAPFLYRLIVLLTAGVTLSFVQAPFDLWPLLFLSLSVFYVLFAASKNKKQAFFSGYVFALGYFIAGLYWIGNALLVEGNDYAWAWPLAVIGLPALLSVFTGLFITVAHIITPKNTWCGFLGFCAVLALSEWVRGHAFTGFPWNLYAYSWIDLLPVAQLSAVVGPYGLNFLTIFWGAALGFFLLNPTQKSNIVTFVVAVVLFVGAYGWGFYTLKSNSTQFNQNVTVQIIQPNIAQEAKWDSSQLVQNFEKHINLSAKISTPDKKNIIIWPETALPPTFINNYAVNERIYSILGVNDLLLAGALNINENEQTGTKAYHNALLLWSPEHRAKQLYSKSHLVPFGEYIPFQKFIPIPTVTQFSGFHKGTGTQTIKVGTLPSFSPLICYEVIFPHEAALNGDMRPDYILTLTNDGWYGDSPGPYQHFVQSRFRAIEQGLPVVRSANTGVSGIIDAQGRIVKSSQLNESVAVVGDLPLKRVTPTFYSRYGDGPFLILTILLLGVAFRSRKIQP